MRAERFFGCLAAVTMATAIASCAPIVRRQGSEGGAGGGGGADPLGGSTAAGGETGTGGSVATGGSTGGGLGGTTSNICGLASSFGWASTQSLMDPVSDGSHSLVAIKAPSAVFYGGKYHVFATVINSSGAATMEHVQFVDWPNASSATADYLDNNAALKGALSQPQVFYLSGKKTWYLLFQGPAPAYSTNSDLSQTAGWTKPTNFYSATPSIVTQNAGSGTPWTDFWVICNTSDCFLFFTNTIGYLFRAKTSLGSFPSGFGDPVVVKQSANALAGGPRVYKVDGGTGGYLMLVEGNGSGGRFIGAWTATAIDAAFETWKPLADTEANPFAGAKNATYVKTTWTRDVGHGELIRSGYDETMAIDNCNMRYLYAGRDPYSTVSTALLPWKLGLLVRSK